METYILLILSSVSSASVLLMNICRSIFRRQQNQQPNIVVVNNIQEPLQPQHFQYQETIPQTIQQPPAQQRLPPITSPPSASTIKQTPKKLPEIKETPSSSSKQNNLSFLHELKVKHTQMDLSSHETFTN